MKKVLTIAGSDCSGGAGIQADIKTIAAHGMYAMSAITALTAQNTTGVYGVHDAPAEFVGQQIDCVFEDIPPEAVKIGMVSSKEIIEIIAEKLLAYGMENVVVDPVMVATSGSSLIVDGAAAALRDVLLPVGRVITPNIPEAEALAEMTIGSHEEMELAARKIAGNMKRIEGRAVPSILIKGGHFGETADDLLYVAEEDRSVWFRGPRIENPNTHGTGCTLSSAIACGLAAGLSVEDSVRSAKDYISGAIADQMDLGRGRGPLNHLYRGIREIK